MNLSALRLAHIKQKLEWSANSEWSAHITPEECQLLLKELEGKCQEQDSANATTLSGEFVD